MKFYCDIYMHKHLKKKQKRIIRNLEKKKVQASIYLITLAANEKNQLEFFHSAMLMQKNFQRAEHFVIGIAEDYEDAVLLVQNITEDVFEKTGSADIRKYICKRQEEYEEREV